MGHLCTRSHFVKKLYIMLTNGCKYTKVFHLSNITLLLMQFRSLKTSVSRLLFQGSLEHDLTWTTVPLGPRRLASYCWDSEKK